jgi:hypothetical protein
MKRKPENIAPEWQCPACQVAYNKVSQQTSYPTMARESMSRGVTQQPTSSPISLKAIFMVVLLGGVLFFGYSMAKDTSFVRSIGWSAQSDKETLEFKKAELTAYEEAPQKVDAQIAHDKANVGICPITGQPNQYILNNDPRPELQTKIDKLKEDIKKLESKS